MSARAATVHCADAPVREVLASPDGNWLVAVLGEGRTWATSTASGAHLLQRYGDGWMHTTKLPAHSQRMFALDQGVAVVVDAAYDHVTITRLDGDGARALESFNGVSLSDPVVALLPSGRELLLQVVDRDDGQGYSEPEYRTITLRIDLESGASAGEPEREHAFLRAPGVPTLSPFAAEPAVRKLVRELPFKREWALRVGPTLLLTDARLMTWPAGETLYGARDEKAGRTRRHFDLSPDEGVLLGCDDHEQLQLWDGAVTPLDVAGARCAAFVSPREFAVGTASGDVCFFSV